MGDFSRMGRQFEATQYVTVAAGVTTAAVGNIGWYLESLTVIPTSTGAGAVTLSDGSTAIVSIPAAAHSIDPHPYKVELGIRATSPTTGFKVTTGASVAVIAVGKFSA